MTIDIKTELQEIEEMRRQLEARTNSVRAAALAEAQKIIDQFSLTADDFRWEPAPAAAQAGKSKRAPVPPKYRNTDGKTWTGRGLKPVWVREILANGGNLDDYLI